MLSTVLTHFTKTLPIPPNRYNRYILTQKKQCDFLKKQTGFRQKNEKNVKNRKKTAKKWPNLLTYLA